MLSLIFSETKQRQLNITRTEIRIKFLGPFVQAIRTLSAILAKAVAEVSLELVHLIGFFFTFLLRVLGRQSKPVEANPMSSLCVIHLRPLGASF